MSIFNTFQYARKIYVEDNMVTYKIMAEFNITVSPTFYAI